MSGFWNIAAADPDRPAVIEVDGGTTTFGQLEAAAGSLARGLRDAGLAEGDTLAAVLPNTATFYVVYLAAMQAGWYLVPVSTHLAPPEAAYVITNSEARAVVVDPAHLDLARPGIADAGIPDERVLVDGGSLDAMIESGADAPPLEPCPAGTAMMYTSGTTGQPKGVRRGRPTVPATEAFAEESELYCTGFGYPLGRAVHLVCGPLYHAAPFSASTCCLHVGNTLVLTRGWDAEQCLQLIDRHGVASTNMVPTMFHRLLQLPDDVKARYDVSSVRSVMHTGAPCPIDVKQRFMEWFGPVVFETYGGTESVATIATPRRWLANPGTVGKVIGGVTVHILDEDGNELPPGEPGTIYIESLRSSQTTYFKDEAKTASMKRGEWVTLGDFGYLDDNGLLYLHDRRVDLILSGGVNIYPAEVEAALLSCPLVGDAAVIGIPDEEWGESVCAVVEPAVDVPPTDATRATIITHCDGRLARFKHPRRIEFVDRLERLPNGKVEKRRLRDRFDPTKTSRAARPGTAPTKTG